MSTDQQSAPSAFNPELFLNTTIDAALSTEYTVLPVGEYVGVIGPISADSFKSFDIKRGENAGKKAYRLDLEIAIDDPEGKLKAELGRAPKVFEGIMLDLKADGSLEFGKGRNVRLGQLRDALGQNLSGRPWSFGMLAGQPVKLTVVQDTYDGKTSNKVKAFGKAF